ncbi:hypothetical protein ACERII_00835 [Evansella sp. AB-rgal1]|uniref:hypothetical protein n=1 Tax=Evansella sp. AB-rgal1 TaxID=3242696 RepID=UPI00359EBAD0
MRRTGIEREVQFPKERVDAPNGNRKRSSIPEGASGCAERESKEKFNSRRSKWMRRTGIEREVQFPKERVEEPNGNRKRSSIPEGASGRAERESKEKFNSRRSEWMRRTGIEREVQFRNYQLRVIRQI